MTILLGLLGLAVGVWLLVYLARRLELPVGPEAQGSLPRKIALVVLVMLTVGLSVCGGAGALIGATAFLETDRTVVAILEMFLVAGLAGLLCAAAGVWLLLRIARRPKPVPVPGPTGPEQLP